MLTKQFAFFSSMLGLVLLNALVGSSATLVSTPIFVGLIWIVSGPRYAAYAFGFWLLVISPALLQFCFFYVNFVPGVLISMQRIFPHQQSSDWILKINYPITWYGLSVANLFFDCWAAQKIGKKVLKQLSTLPYLRH